MPHTLHLFASHLSRNNVLTLKVFLGLTKTDPVAIWEYTDDREKASALLINTDEEEGNLRLKEWASENKRQVLIAFSSRIEGFPPNVLVLPRPLRSVELIPVLQQASKQFLDFFQGQEEKGSQAKQLGGKAYSADVDPPVRRILDVLCGNQGRILKIVDKIARSVVFDISHRRYYAIDHVKMEIEDFLISPAVDAQIEEVDYSQLAKFIQNLQIYDLDVPLWAAVLTISNGRLFNGLSFTEFYRLNRWPDLKKLGQNSFHLKLATLLRRGGTVDYFADFLKAPVGDVIDYINACHTLNYLERQEKSILPAKVFEQKPSDTNTTVKRSLFSRIRSRLGI